MNETGGDGGRTNYLLMCTDTSYTNTEHNIDYAKVFQAEWNKSQLVASTAG